MKRLIAVAGFLALIGLTTAGNSGAETHIGNARVGYKATVLCLGATEDSMAHVRLVRFKRHPDGTLTLIYRCKRFGY
jgi:hypothetical protein